MPPQAGKGVLPVYPPDHKVGMRVPKGGSACSKCKYVDGQDCTQKDFVKWNGGELIPSPTNEFCCDFFETGREGSWVRRASGR